LMIRARHIGSIINHGLILIWHYQWLMPVSSGYSRLCWAHAERAIRKRRKVSGSTRSRTGKRCRDTFTSLKKTCRKLGIPFWRYLQDRIGC